jgi:tetratricopeptide (TPR) repeat protein
MAKYSLSSRITTPRPEYQSARSLAAAGLAVCRELDNESDLALALLWNGEIAYYGGEPDAARTFCEESQALFEKTGNQIYIGLITEYLGILSLTQGDQATARRYFQKCLVLAQEMKDKTTGMVASLFLGLTAYYQQDFDLMETDAQASLALSREVGSPSWRMFSLRTVGIAALRQGQWRRSIEFFLENLSLAQKTAGYEYDLQVFPTYMAGVAADLGRFDRAARLLGATEAQFETFFKPLDPWEQAEFDRIATSARARLDEETLTAAWAKGRALTLDQAIQEAKGVADLGSA